MNTKSQCICNSDRKRGRVAAHPSSSALRRRRRRPACSPESRTGAPATDRHARVQAWREGVWGKDWDGKVGKWGRWQGLRGGAVLEFGRGLLRPTDMQAWRESVRRRGGGDVRAGGDGKEMEWAKGERQS
eukprot:356830-Chlamydomonas_euryale.AAC.2